MKYLALMAILAACDGKPGRPSESRIERAKDCQQVCAEYGLKSVGVSVITGVSGSNFTVLEACNCGGAL